MTELSRHEQARRALGMPIGELWYQYFSLGGMGTSLEIEAFLYGARDADPHDRDLVAVALNERYTELGGDHPVPYSGDQKEGSP